MIIRDFKRARKFTSIEAICGNYVFNIFATDAKMDIAVFSHSFEPLNFFHVRPDFKANTLILDVGEGVVVSFDNNAFIRCMQGSFDDCPADDIKTIFETMFYID